MGNADSEHGRSRRVRFSSSAHARGFTAAWNEVIFDEALSLPARMLYLHLSHYGWSEAEPDQDEIAGPLGLKTRQLREYVRELEDAGLVESRRRGRGLPNRYVVRSPEPSTDRRSTADLDRRSTAAESGALPPVSPIGLKTEDKPSADASASTVECPPKIEHVDGRHPVMDEVARTTGVLDGSPRYREVVVAVNGTSAQPGIVAQEWALLTVGVRQQIVAAGAEAWAERLRVRVAKTAVEYGRRMPGAILTPVALAKWWTDLAPPAARRLDATPPPPCPECEMGGGLHAADCPRAATGSVRGG